ncbi:MAG TPA: zinc-dependent metalloprotease [Longimicrobiales bacterium]|nr:zinc-dependent metalloprotease [Longimicrobiales bacterium]
MLLRRVARVAALAVALFPVGVAAQQQDGGALPTIASKTAGMQKLDGFMPLYWDEQSGRMYLEIGRFDEDVLYYTSLPAGVGHNDIGLNRGDLGGTYVVRFRRVGPKVLMVQPNLDFRATTDNAMERRAVEDAFATSTIWGWTAAARTGNTVLVDATDFFLRDSHGLANTLRRMNQGNFRVEPSRSAFHLPRTKNFPQNTEVEATITFTGENPGGLVRSVTPTPDALTVRMHHSFVELPTGYEPREADPRAGYFGVTYMDYATPLGERMVKQYIARHRLEKRDPTAAVSEPVEAIVYYLDPGTPEPVRSALLEGGNWWNDAFEAAGFRNAFRVEMLPDTADPMDVRYNVIQWVHRSTRGWSYGSSITDPRTGEILKGHVTLGSLRVRQDYLLAEGLLSPYETGDEVPPQLAEMALARLRQLSAHEIGHTLGIAHNYIASAQTANGVQSVMDYPHPIAELRPDGSIDLSGAYPDGIGAWDIVAVKYGYSDFAPGTNEDAALAAIIEEGRRAGITFLSDQDARPVGSAHPQTHLWDNGADAVAELRRMLEVREAALERFGERAIRRGAPLATIEEALVPLYLHHRYQTEAAVKSIAGVTYAYNLRGDGQPLPESVAPEVQRRALDAVLETVSPEVLALPRSVIAQIPPRPYRFGGTNELFERSTGLVFDAVSPAAAAADMTFSLLLDPERAARLVQQSALDPSLPGLEDVLERVREQVVGRRTSDPYRAELARTVEHAWIDNLMRLAANASMPQVRAIAAWELAALQQGFEQRNGDVPATAHARLLAGTISEFLERDWTEDRLPSAPDAPPGQPIGGGYMDLLMCSY